MQSYRSLRWMLLFCVLVMTALPLTPVLAYDDEEHHHDMDEQHDHHHHHQEEEQHYEQEHHHQEEEQQEHHYQEEEPVQEEEHHYEQEVVQEQAHESAVSAKKSIKDCVTGIVDKVTSEAKSVVERVKSMNKADAKKVAAAALGVWGVSVGVGWLAQTVKAGASDGVTKKSSFGMKK
jgi:flagellar biosynthesis component FlhA